jgi:hypothetical protein
LVTVSAGATLKIDTAMSSPEFLHAEDMPLKLNVRIEMPPVKYDEDHKAMLLPPRKGGFQQLAVLGQLLREHRHGMISKVRSGRRNNARIGRTSTKSRLRRSAFSLSDSYFLSFL